MFQKTGLRGASSTMVKWLIETGISGFVLSISWFLIVAFRIFKKLIFEIQGENNRIFAVGLMGVHLLAMFDFCLYSQVFWSQGVLAPLYFLLLAFAFSGKGDVCQSYSFGIGNAPTAVN